MKIVLAAGCILVAVFALILGLACVGGSSSTASAATEAEACATSGPIPGLSSIAATNARIVAATAEQMGGSSGAVIADLVGYTESGLRVLGNPSVIGAGGPAQGTGADHDSVGIFQQRASWGTLAQRLDPAQSTRLFMTRLLANPNWQNKQPWVAAQDVQASAYDGRPRAANHDSATYGGNYKRNIGFMQQVAAQIEHDAARLVCGALSGGVAANTAPGSHGLPSDYVVPANATPAEATVILFAIAQLDKPYVFDAAGPDAYDCSGLVMVAWERAGVELPHSSEAQAHDGIPTTPSALLPGDLVLVAGDDGTLAAPGHVGLYIGDGLVLNAADEHDGIRVQTYPNFVKAGRGLSALRHIE